MANQNQIVRNIKLDSASLEAAMGALQGVEGIDALEQVGPQRLRITYDVTRTGWGALLEKLKAADAEPAGGLFARWRNDWRDFQEQNMRDNLRHQPACCSKPPAGAGRKD